MGAVVVLVAVAVPCVSASLVVVAVGVVVVVRHSRWCRRGTASVRRLVGVGICSRGIDRSGRHSSGQSCAEVGLVVVVPWPWWSRW